MKKKMLEKKKFKSPPHVKGNNHSIINLNNAIFSPFLGINIDVENSK
jgi:hypothetical protein